MAQTYLSVPRINRLEYLDVFLQSYQDDYLDETKAKQAVQQKIQEFEQNKARALRQHRHRSREDPTISFRRQPLKATRTRSATFNKGASGGQANDHTLSPPRRRLRAVTLAWHVDLRKRTDCFRSL